VSEDERENPIRLALLSEQALFRESLGRYLASQPGLAVIIKCGSAAEALEILSATPVDIVLVDFDQRESGGEFMANALRAGYQGRFLIVAGETDARDAANAIHLGASGIFLKSGPPDRLVLAIRLVADGAVWLDQRVIQMLADRFVERPRPDDPRSGASLTDRDQQVLLGILGGLTNRRIGNNLGLSENSVKSAVQQLFRRTGVRTRSQLVRVALESSLVAVKALPRSL
jgi:DNA-binding NarL/FixJ family response regulator